MKFVRAKYSKMKTVVEECLKQNMGKAMFSIIFFMFLYMVVLFVAVMSMMLPLSEMENLSYSGTALFTVLSYIFVFAAFVLVFMLLYGLNVIMAKLVEKSFVTLGHLFSGFKELKKKVFLSSLVFAAIYAVVIAVCCFVLYFNKEAFENMFDSSDVMETMQFMSAVSLVVIAVLFLVSLPFVFVFLFLYTRPEDSFIKSFGNSVKLLWGRFFHFIGFELYAGGWWLLALVVSDACIYFLPKKLASIAELFRLISFISQFMTMARLSIALPVYFYSTTGRVSMDVQPSAYSSASEQHKNVLTGIDVKDAEDVQVVDSEVIAESSDADNQNNKDS